MIAPKTITVTLCPMDRKEFYELREKQSFPVGQPNYPGYLIHYPTHTAWATQDEGDHLYLLSQEKRNN